MREYARDLYHKESLIKSAYAFTDKWYIHLDVTNTGYLVELKTKQNETDESLYDQFENELIAQECRLVISRRTSDIRKLIVARALSSTMVMNTDEQEISEVEDESEILSDWFEINE